MIQNVHYQTLYPHPRAPEASFRVSSARGPRDPPRTFRPASPRLARRRRIPAFPPAHTTRSSVQFPRDPSEDPRVMNRLSSRHVLVLASVLLAACQAGETPTNATTKSAPRDDAVRGLRSRLELPVAEAPFTNVKANWKERLEQPYVFVEMRGTYTQTARRIKDVMEAVEAAGGEAVGAPFALFYDDPGRVPVDELRSRACIPVAAQVPLPAPFEFDVLPQATVAYAFVGGPYGEVPRAYPGVFAFLSKMNWVEAGPIRETYLVAPGAVDSWEELVCEVQIPAEPRR